MKPIISLIAGILVAVGIFFLDAALINWIISGIQNSDTRTIVKIILWIISLSWTIGLAILFGTTIAALVMNLISKD